MKNNKKQINQLLFLLGFWVCLLSNTNTFANSLLNAKYISYSDLGEGEALVLIHAFPTDKTLWLPQQQALKHHFRVITMDLWGFGHSEGTIGNAVMVENYADQIAQLLDHLYIKKAIIGGESTGGYIALSFLQKYPDRVTGLILSNTQTIADSPETRKNQEATAEQALEQGTEQLSSRFIATALSADAKEQTRLFLQNMVMIQAPTGIASALRGMTEREDLTNTLMNTNVPVLIITSDKDTVIAPQQSANMHSLAKNSKLVVISDAGHLASLEQPEQWNKAILEMFTKSNNS